jgi:hypothetical protein
MDAWREKARQATSRKRMRRLSASLGMASPDSDGGPFSRGEV